MAEEMDPRDQLAAIVDSADDAIISKDLHGVVQSINAAGERMFGFKAAELVGHSILALIPPERHGEEEEILERIRRGERVERYETVRRRKDGTLIDVSLTISPVRDASGVVVGASKIARDVTAVRRDALALAELAAIVTSSDDAIISMGIDGVVRSFNCAAERMYGWTAQEAVGRSVMMFIPPERHAEEEGILERLRRGERVDHYETVRERKDGRRIDVTLTVSPLRDSRGHVIGASKIARDVTESRRARAALAEQQEWFRITLNSITDAVVAVDRAGRIGFLNEQAERLTGWALEQAEGRPLSEVVRVHDERVKRRLEDPTARVLAVGRPVELRDDVALEAQDGQQRPISLSAAPIKDGDDITIGVVLVFRDVTDERRREETSRRMAAERERLLRNERAARSEAERASRVKDEFVAMVSHELRTPLNAILGWSELLRRQRDDPTTLEHGLEVITRNTRLQAQLIADLLDVSRIVSGKLHLEFEEVDMVVVLKNVIESLRSPAEEKGVTVVARFDAPTAVVAGDSARLQQIAINLVSNALKFTPGGGQVTVGLQVTEEHAEYTVSDTGIGIRPEILPNIFERFRQDSSATTRRHGGLGLGLSIVKHLTELHGGAVHAWSAGEGAGATFTVAVPLLGRGPRRVTRGALGDAAEFAPEPTQLAGIRVLIVEDDADTRELVRRILEEHGAEVLAASNAPDAIRAAATQRPAVLLSDIGLPDMDGYELIGVVRQMASPAGNVPAVALTAFARPEDKHRALRAGFDAHVAKPIEPAELVATVRGFGRFNRPDEPRA